MRLSEFSYSRDLLSFNVAVRMLRQDARTRTISAWTGISAERVRKLWMGQRREGSHRLPRRERGPTPSHLEAVLKSESLRSEAAAVAGVCRMLEVVPPERWPTARGAVALLVKGEQVLSARELFQDIIPRRRLTFEEWLLLLHSLADGTAWSVARCERCPAMVVVDRLTLASALCEACQHKRRSKKTAAVREARRAQGANGRAGTKSPPVQLGLFDEKGEAHDS